MPTPQIHCFPPLFLFPRVLLDALAIATLFASILVAVVDADAHFVIFEPAQNVSNPQVVDPSWTASTVRRGPTSVANADV
jgi:hypothetical protein